MKILPLDFKEKTMSRTMTKQEYEKFKKFVEKKSSELNNKRDSIAFLQKVGFCDEKGAVVYPYNSSRKR